MRALKALVAMAVGAAFCLVGQPVQAGVVPPCSWDVGSRTLTINLVALGGSDAVHVGRVPDSNQLGYLTIDDWVPCPSGTVNSANLLVVKRHAGLRLRGGESGGREVGAGTHRRSQGAVRARGRAAARCRHRQRRVARRFDAELRSSCAAPRRRHSTAIRTQTSPSTVCRDSTSTVRVGTMVLSAHGAAARVTGGNGGDELFGSRFRRRPCAATAAAAPGARTSLIGQGGNDELSGGPARDTYYGGGRR